MENLKDYLFLDDVMGMNSKQIGKQIHSCSVLTPNYIFVIPKKAVGMFVIVNTIKTHDFFQGGDIANGVKKMINASDNIVALEESFKSLLENDERYVYPIEEAKTIKVKGFLGRKTLMYRKSAMNHMSISPKGKAIGKDLVEWHLGNYEKVMA